MRGGSISIPPVEFDRSNSTGHEILVKMGVNSLRLHLYAWLIELGSIPVITYMFLNFTAAKDESSSDSDRDVPEEFEPPPPPPGQGRPTKPSHDR